MRKARQRLLYIIYFVFMTVVFLYLLFPEDAAKQFLMTHINRIDRNFNIAFAGVNPAFPPGLGLSDVQVYHNNDPVFKAEKVNVALGILPLFLLRPTLKFKCDAYEGSINGKVGVSAFDLSKVSGNVHLKNVNVAHMDALHTVLPQYNLSGRISGNLNGGTKKNNEVAFKSDLRATDCGIEFLVPIYGMDGLSFSEIETEVEMDGRLLKIDRLITKGSDLAGSASGTIMIRHPIQRSKLNIKGEVNPGPNIISQLGEMGPMVNVFLKNRPGKKGIPINLNGTLQNPGFFNFPGRR